MKKSQLKQIVREEIYRIVDEENEFDDAMDKFKKKIGIQPPTSENTMKYESLPGYAELPATREDVKNFQSGLKLPSVDAGSVSTLLSKAEVKRWFEAFKLRYKEAPQFKVEGGKIEVTNPKFKEALELHAEAVKRFGTKGD